MSRSALRVGTQLAVAVGGVAALSWEAVWQIHAALSLGISAVGTALTLAATMGGMTVGSLLMGAALRARTDLRPLRLYGYLEAVIGLSGLLIIPGFVLIEQLDALVYRVSPAMAPLFHVVAIVLLLGPPTLAMGATVPTFALMARSTNTSVARLYGINTVGAALGVLLITFVLVPRLGVSMTCVSIAALNGLVLVAMWLLDRRTAVLGTEQPEAAVRGFSLAPGDWLRPAVVIVFGTGFVSFALEVAWFRALRAAFQSTTEVFAIILAAVLLPLAIAAHWVPRLRRRGVMPKALLGNAAIAILVATPLVERMDLTGIFPGGYLALLVQWTLLQLVILGPAVLFLGMALPWYLEEAGEPRMTGRLYAVNTLGAVFGSVSAAWLLLPNLGFSRTAWLMGIVTAALALVAPGRRSFVTVLAGTAVALLVTVQFTSNLGRDRLQSSHDLRRHEIIAFAEGPDSTVAVIESPLGIRSLLIDGFGASSERAEGSAYMDWMGHLPMLLHENPRNALVICFGTGLTANAVRHENPLSLDVVDVSPTVFQMAPYFRTNDGVLQDARVRAVVMDGRAWLRRNDKSYDVVTLEPMPPYFAGVNALYSLDFYEIVAANLTREGVVAQWVPFHLLPPFFAASVVATFLEAFPDSILWLDPYTSTGILLGRRAGSAKPLGEQWPGLSRPIARPLAGDRIRELTVLNSTGVALYAEKGIVITDDNQLLAYGMLRRDLEATDFAGSRQQNLDTIHLLSSIQPR